MEQMDLFEEQYKTLNELRELIESFHWTGGINSDGTYQYETYELEFYKDLAFIVQFRSDTDNNERVIDNCCRKMKKEPIKKWEKQNNRHITITGMRNSEGGQRASIKGCILTDKSGNITKFHPLIKVNDEWEKWIVEEKHIELAKVYLPPYNFQRTGCKGCPFSLDLQKQLEIMELYMPNERKQCEYIWKPVYDEYRRLNYRLKKVERVKLF